MFTGHEMENLFFWWIRHFTKRSSFRLPGCDYCRFERQRNRAESENILWDCSDIVQVVVSCLILIKIMKWAVKTLNKNFLAFLADLVSLFLNCCRIAAAFSCQNNMDGTINITDRHFYLLIFLAIRFSGTLQTQLGSVCVGAMLSSSKMDSILQEIALEINTNASKSPKFNFSSSTLSKNPIRSALDVCEKLVTQKVYVVIVGSPENTHSPPIAVSYTCGFYQIPVIGISTRESIFSDKVSVFFEYSITIIYVRISFVIYTQIYLLC